MPNKSTQQVVDYLRAHGADLEIAALVSASPLSERATKPSVRAVADDAFEVMLTGEIGWEVTASGVLAALQEADGQDLIIRISSPGGSAFDGFAIYNMLARYPGLKQIVVESVAASAASIIAMAGDEIVMAPASFLMIHNSMGMTMGNDQAHEATLAVLRRIDATMAGIYADKTGMPNDQIVTMMAAETWMTADEAVALEFADRVEQIPEPAEAKVIATPRASSLVNAFRKAPAAVLAMVAQPIPSAVPPVTPPAPPVQHTQETTMSAPAATTPPGGSSAAVQTDPLAVINATLEQIQAVAARAKLGSDWVVAQLVAKVTEDQARDNALKALVDAQPQRPGIIGSPAPASTVEAIGKSIVASIAKHGGVKTQQTLASAEPMNGFSLYDMASEYYEARTGRRARLPAAQLYREVFAMGTVGMQTTTDFASLLNLGAEAIVIDTALAVSNSWRQIGRTYSFDNFRLRDVAGGFDVPDLEEVQEHEEIRYGAIARALGKLGLKTFAKGFAFSRQAIINNDLTQFTADSATFGAMAGRSLSNRVWRVFALGTTSAMNMSDGNPFLSVGHNNFASGGSAITETSLIAAESALASQAAVAGKPLNLAGRYLIVGVGRRHEAMKFLNSERLADNTTNVYKGAYDLIYEPAFPTNAWALLADPALHPVIAVSLLGGREAPEVVTEASFDTFGIKVRVSLDYEAAPIDWNGVYYNPGP